MRAREPNSWSIRCHRTWTRELAAPQVSTAVSCPSTGWRWWPRNFWCFWYDKLLEQPSEHLWQTVPHRSRHPCCACKSDVPWKGFFCMRPAYCWSQKQNGGDWKRETWHRETVSVFEYMLTTSLFLIQGVLYELLIGFMFVVLFLSVLLIATCGRLSWPALWTTRGRTIK